MTRLPARSDDAGTPGTRPICLRTVPGSIRGRHHGAEIRSYLAGHDDSLFDLLREVLGETPAKQRTAASWSWKHRKNPFGASRGLCAWEPSTRNALGLRLFMRWAFIGRDRELVPGLRAVDTAIHPAHRRQGLFTLLTDGALRSATGDAAFVFNTPNPISLAGYRKLGWRLVTRWPLYFHVRRPARFAARPADLPGPGHRRTRARVDRIASSWDACFARGITRWGDFLDRHQRRLGSFVRGAERGRGFHGYRTPRTLRYLRWRYGGHPHLAYGVHEISDADGLAGFVVMRPNRRRGLHEILVTEMVLGRPDLPLARALLTEAVEASRADYLVAHFAAGSLEARALGDAGFRPVRGESIPFAVRPLRHTTLDPLRAPHWDLSLGDLEVF